MFLGTSLHKKTSRLYASSIHIASTRKTSQCKSNYPSITRHTIRAAIRRMPFRCSTQSLVRGVYGPMVPVVR